MESLPGTSKAKACFKQERPESVDQSNSQEYDDIGEYYFESDHVALKTNSDYKNMLKTMALLESQRIQAIKDLDKLHEIKKEALSDPISFVNRLQRKENIPFPSPQEVSSLPVINWNQYALNSGYIPGTNRRTVGRNWTKGFGPYDEENDSQDGVRSMVRGRLHDGSKSASFNQLWTAEEQKKLEELLLLYPPEDVEAHRWGKIAKALGNRTTVQVASRVQKFFIKLSKAGMPVPGRKPNLNSQKKGNTGKRSGRPSLPLYQFTNSSFFKHNLPPVFMNECEREIETQPSPVSNERELDGSNEESEDENEFGDLKNDPEYKELLFLKKLKEEKLGLTGLAQHVGFKCNRCNCEPIIGTRWHCFNCPTSYSTDFCNNCIDCQHESGPHTLEHKLEPIKQAETFKPFLDRDYVHFMGGDYNYLDPNYMPAAL